MSNDPTYVKSEIEAKPEYHIAWLLSEYLNDDAPIGWSNYRASARLLLEHYTVTRKNAQQEPKP
jgi:hypothetical protein